MNEDTSRGFELPCLEAIQKIPGNTASEKFRWIGKLASNEPNAIENHGTLSPELLSLLRVEIAVKHKRHEDIKLALISNVSPVVSRALKASWFFDGRHEIVDITYFCQEIFPFVCPHTRNRIVKTLSRRIQNPAFAQEMFTAVASTYNTETALPLFVACNDNFVFQTVNTMNILLPYKIFKTIFQKNPRLGRFLFEFFAFSYARFVPHSRDIFDKYKYFSRLMKNDPLACIRINTVSLDNSHKYMLSNTCAKTFLQKTLEYVIKNIESYYTILPKKIFNEMLLKKFPDLNNPLLHGYYRNELLDILVKHPQERYLEQRLKIYRDICNNKLVDMENVSAHVLRLLPVEKRMQLIENNFNINLFYKTMASKTEWICYFPAKLATSVIKVVLSQISDESDKFNYILKMIYACKVNNDENELYNILKYVIESYLISYNAAADKEKLRIITEFSKPLYLSERNGLLVYRIIQMFYEHYGYVEQDVLDLMILHRLIHQKSIADLIEMLLKTNDNYAPISFKLGALRDYPHHERQFLLSFLNVIEEFYAVRWGEKLKQESEEVKRQGTKQRRKILIEEDENGEKFVLCRLVVAMYDFNEKCKKFDLELMSLKDYPYLMHAIYIIIVHLEINFPSRTMVRILLHKYEPKLYRNWFLPDTSKNIADVMSDAALRLLKQDSQSVLDNWEEYLIDCKRHYRYKHVQRFVRATRWYKDIPIKFAERCISDLYGEDTREIAPALIILTFLLDVKSVAKVINMSKCMLRFALTMEQSECILNFIKVNSN